MKIEEEFLEKKAMKALADEVIATIDENINENPNDKDIGIIIFLIKFDTGLTQFASEGLDKEDVIGILETYLEKRKVIN